MDAKTLLKRVNEDTPESKERLGIYVNKKVIDHMWRYCDDYEISMSRLVEELFLEFIQSMKGKK